MISRRDHQKPVMLRVHADDPSPDETRRHPEQSDNPRRLGKLPGKPDVGIPLNRRFLRLFRQSFGLRSFQDSSVESAQSAVTNIRKNPFFSPPISQIGAGFPQKSGIRAQKDRRDPKFPATPNFLNNPG